MGDDRRWPFGLALAEQLPPVVALLVFVGTPFALLGSVHGSDDYHLAWWLAAMKALPFWMVVNGLALRRWRKDGPTLPRVLFGLAIWWCGGVLVFWSVMREMIH